MLRKLRIGLVFGALFVGALAPSLRAQSLNDWLAPNPVLGARENLPASQQLPETLASAGNIACETTSFRVRPKIPPLQQEIVETGCAVKTMYGLTAPGGYVRMLGADARLHNNGGGPVNIYSVPDQKGAVVLENTAQGQRLHYYRTGAYGSRREFNFLTGEWRFYLDSTPSWTLKDKAGKILHVRPDSVAFSSNGKWLVADSAFLATLLVNLETGEVTPFSSPYTYHLGLSVTPHLAVSDDGRTVATTSDAGDFKITDTSSCAAVPISITGPVACASKTHHEFLRTQINGLHRIYQPRFLNDDLLSFYASYNTTPTTRALAKLRMVPSGKTIDSQDYLALGDSFTSGEGAYNYFPETDTAENMCHLSKQSYPYLIGPRLGLNSYNSVACSGAKIQDITTYVQKQNIPSPNTMGRLLPGFKRQIQYVRDQNPNVVTVGIGGNDVGFISKMKLCLGPGTCYQNFEDRLEMVREINRQFANLTQVYRRLRLEAKPGARVYAIGYPRVADPTGKCPVSVPLDSGERQLVNQLIDYLNRIISLSAASAGVQYIDVEEAFNGHKLCQANGQNVAMNGIMAGDDIWGLFGNESFHPNRLGYQLYAQNILNQSQNFTVMQPSPQSGTSLPAEDSGLEILSGPRSNRPVRSIVNDESISGDLLVKGRTLTVSTDPDKHFLEPKSDFKVELHSEPVLLGAFTTDSSGVVAADITIPTTIEPGFHALHIFAKDVMGGDVDIYKTVYIAETESDYDGDGLINSLDSDNLTAHQPPASSTVVGQETSQVASAKDDEQVVEVKEIEQKPGWLKLLVILGTTLLVVVGYFYYQNQG